ncbi:MAG: type VI secretion system contractile sheath large subunit [Deltaproteobacteria bacterium]|nr:type VI secretion system contractile sheath large subunit [Deltaproteobacteria bacterium]
MLQNLHFRASMHGMPPSGRVGFEFSFSTGKPAPTRPVGQRLRLLFLANFAGQSLPPFTVKKVNGDDLDGLVAAFSPQVHVAFNNESPATLSFASLDDFAPDELLRRVPVLMDLQRTRAELLNPATFAATAARLGLAQTTAAQPTPPAPTSLFAGLLGGEVAKPSIPPAPSPSGLDAVLARAVAPHIVPAADPQQKSLVSVVDQNLADALRSVLHTPAFASVEAAWRGLQRVVEAFSGDPSVELWVASAPPEVLLADAVKLQTNLDASLLGTLLCGEDAAWSMVIVDHMFGRSVDDLIALGALGALAGRAGICAVASGDAALAGGAASDVQELWQTLRQSPLAPHLALVHPRLLLRLPYGPRRNEVQSFPFDELGTQTEPPPQRLLWGSGAWAVAGVLARSFTEDPDDLPLGASAEVDGIPTLVFVDKHGDKQLYPSCESWLSETQAQTLLGSGLIPLVGNRSLAQASLFRLQSIAQPPQPLWLRKVSA